MTPTRAAKALAVFSFALLAGCEHRFFQAAGAVASDGGSLGRWLATPQGCSRDAASGQTTAGASPVVSLAWFDPYIHDRLSPEQRLRRPNSPLWLELQRGPAGLVARLRTVQTETVTTLDASSCSTLDLTTFEGKPALPDGRPTLQGTLHLDCRVHDSHVTAQVRFAGCEY